MGLKLKVIVKDNTQVFFIVYSSNLMYSILRIKVILARRGGNIFEIGETADYVPPWLMPCYHKFYHEGSATTYKSRWRLPKIVPKSLFFIEVFPHIDCKFPYITQHVIINLDTI